MISDVKLKSDLVLVSPCLHLGFDSVSPCLELALPWSRLPALVSPCLGLDSVLPRFGLGFDSVSPCIGFGFDSVLLCLTLPNTQLSSRVNIKESFITNITFIIYIYTDRQTAVD